MAKYYKEKNENVGSEIYSQRIADLLFEKQITQEELAQKTGISKSTITAWIQGRYEPKVNGLNAVAKELDVTLDYLVGNSDIRKPNTKLQTINNITGLSEKTIRLLNKIKKIDSDKELPKFFDSDTGERFLYSIIDYFNSVRADIKFRGDMAYNEDEPFLQEYLKESVPMSIQEYEIIAFRISKLLQQYFDESTEKLYEPLIAYEKQRNSELLTHQERLRKIMEGINNGKYTRKTE